MLSVLASVVAILHRTTVFSSDLQSAPRDIIHYADMNRVGLFPVNALAVSS